MLVRRPHVPRWLGVDADVGAATVVMVDPVKSNWRLVIIRREMTLARLLLVDIVVRGDHFSLRIRAEADPVRAVGPELHRVEYLPARADELDGAAGCDRSMGDDRCLAHHPPLLPKGPTDIGALYVDQRGI